MIFDSFMKTAEQYPGRIAVIDERGCETSYGELLRRVFQIANTIQNSPPVSENHAGQVPNICVFGERNADAIAAMYAAMISGYAYHFMDHSQPENAIRNTLSVTQPSLAICTGFEHTQAYWAHEPVDQPYLSGRTDPYETAPCFLDLTVTYPCSINPERRATLTDIVDRPHYIERDPHKIAFIYPTSGTTKAPKLACTSHHTALITHSCYGRDIGYDKGYYPNVPVRGLLGNDYSGMDISPVLATGGTLVFMPELLFQDPHDLRAFFDNNDIRIWPENPYVLSLALKEDSADTRVFENIDLLVTSGEKLQPAFLDKFFERYPGKTIFYYFGATDFEYVFGQVLTKNNYREMANRFVPNPAIPFHIDDTGELHVAREAAVTCYLGEDSPAQTEQYFPTGDLFTYEPDFNGTPVFKHTGRASDLFKTFGFTIEPRQVEELIRHKCDLVADIALIPRHNESLCLIVQQKDNADPEEIKSELERVVNENMDRDLTFLSGLEIAIWKNPLPKTNSGKIDRRCLLDTLNQKHGGKMRLKCE